MKTGLIVFVAAVLIFVMMLAGGAFYIIAGRSLSGPRVTPLESSAGGKPAAPLPKDAIVLTVADGAEVVAPFVVHDESGAVGGIAAFQPKGTRTDEHPGKVNFKAKTETAGSYIAWVHAKWRDTCSNSCSLKVAAGNEAAVGNDDVFNVWHWVPAGKHTFAAGDNPVAVVEREDGIFVDQILFTQDATYQPTGAITTAGVLRDVRRFADTFTRSPGHGNEGWTFEGKGKFDIAFSFDPNRIPNQYALSGDAKAGPCVAYVQGAPWYGCKMSYSFMPTSDGRFGCMMDAGTGSKLFAGFEMNGANARAFVQYAENNPGFTGPINLRLNQWHHVVVEHWAWITRIWLDGKEVLSRYDDLTKSGKAGLIVQSGSAVFDDFEIEEIPWMADDGKDLKIDWALSPDSKWSRADFASGMRMTGEAGSIKAGLGGIPLEEIVLDERSLESADGLNAKAFVSTVVTAPGLTESKSDSNRNFRLSENANGSCTHAMFEARQAGTAFRRVALRFGRHTPQTFNVGPYTFSTYEMEDPSDYLDFTEEEYKAMSKSPEAAKLKRHAKIKPVIGHGVEDDEGPWAYLAGNWRIDVKEGCLRGRGAGSRLMHAQEIASDMEMRFKVRLADNISVAEVELYSGADPGLRVQLAQPSVKSVPLPPGGPIAMRLDVNADKQWHEVTLRVEGSKLSAKIDHAPLKETEFKRGDGDRIFLKLANGAADFDDVEFIAQRATDKSVLYAFNQPEPDWWRESPDKWIDHGGIACVLASSWISLVAPASEGTMWNKRTFTPNVLVAFNVEENSEWYGWDKYPSHTHFPFDNVETTLANEKNPEMRYTLVVNGEGHTSTILFRNGKEVARVRQDAAFPMHYVGQHMPFFPRVNRICLIKRGGVLRGIVNGKEVLTFTDPTPLDVTKVGLGGHNTRVNFSHIEILNLEAAK